MPNNNTIFFAQFSKTSKTIYHIQRVYCKLYGNKMLTLHIYKAELLKI